MMQQHESCIIFHYKNVCLIIIPRNEQLLSRRKNKKRERAHTHIQEGRKPNNTKNFSSNHVATYEEEHIGLLTSSFCKRCRWMYRRRCRHRCCCCCCFSSIFLACTCSFSVLFMFFPLNSPFSFEVASFFLSFMKRSTKAWRYVCMCVCVYKMNAKNGTVVHIGNAYMRYLCPSTCRRFIALTFLFKSFFKLITYSLLHKFLFHTHTRTHTLVHT